MRADRVKPELRAAAHLARHGWKEWNGEGSRARWEAAAREADKAKGA